MLEFSINYWKFIVVIVTVVNLGWVIFDKTRNEFQISNSKEQTFYHRRNATVNLHQPNLSWNRSVTVVTAYFNLGTFRKGRPGKYFTTDTYHNWANIFQHIDNPTIIYTDSENFTLHMTAIRRKYAGKTKIIVIKRSSSWAFQNIEKIEKIFGSSQYPKHYPNTVVPAYACAQHAKYDMVERAAKMNVFDTKYYMWLDIGYFRNRKSQKKFYLTKPPGFNDTKIAYNLVYSNRKLSQTPEYIMKKNLVLIGGGLFFGERYHVVKFCTQFRKAVDFFLSQGLTNTDQQILYAMFSNTGRRFLKPEVELQIYTPSHDDDWFYLGTIMINEIQK